MNKIEYTHKQKLRVVTLFSGYDSQCLALERLKQAYPDFDYELVAWCEIDKAAIISHNALFPQWSERNLGDITEIDAESVPDCDLITWSFPCTDLSVAGRQQGMTEGSGTRSSLAWDAIRIFRAKRPKYLLMENVKALVQKKFINDYNSMLVELCKIGYSNFTKVLDAKDYGVPQHRERVFCVSILEELCNTPPSYSFPLPFPLEKRLKDVLERNVDEKYYLSDEMLDRFQQYGRVNSSQDGVISDSDGVSRCHTAGHGNCPKVIEE